MMSRDPKTAGKPPNPPLRTSAEKFRAEIERDPAWAAEVAERERLFFASDEERAALRRPCPSCGVSFAEGAFPQKSSICRSCKAERERQRYRAARRRKLADRRWIP
jgi:hypothetical protein